MPSSHVPASRRPWGGDGWGASGVGGGGAVRGTGVPRHTSPVHCFPAVTTNEAVRAAPEIPLRPADSPGQPCYLSGLWSTDGQNCGGRNYMVWTIFAGSKFTNCELTPSEATLTFL